MGTPGAVLKSVRASLARLSMDRLDLYLMHLPGITPREVPMCQTAPVNGPTLRKAVWDEMLQARAAGLVRSVGVANFATRHLQELLAQLPSPSGSAATSSSVGSEASSGQSEAATRLAMSPRTTPRAFSSHPSAR